MRYTTVLIETSAAIIESTFREKLEPRRRIANMNVKTVVYAADKSAGINI